MTIGHGDVPKTSNGERGTGNGERGTGNGEQKSGIEKSSVTDKMTGRRQQHLTPLFFLN